MNEGELKKRIHEEILRAIIDKDVPEIDPILDEAKQEFPKMLTSFTSEQWEINERIHLNAILVWFKKWWFGE